ncbi:MAG: HAD family phosphatase [Methanomassiliicoccales archaeon]|nr:MAG: HAD family phosphatase [Methanomassiliicoccales archaeon]
MSSAVIFDLDGILVESERYKHKAWQKAFRTIGIEMSWEDFLQEWVVKGSSFSETLERYGYQGTIEEDDLRPIVNEHYLRSIEEDICALPGAIDVLERLYDEFPLGLASSSTKVYVDKTIEKLGIADRFVATACGSEVKRLKPSPDVLLLAAERMDVDPKVCVAIDDAPKGVLAAKGAGMSAIAVPTKDTQFGDFDKADIVLPSLNEITPHLIRML